jgi:hypothetical protein
MIEFTDKIKTGTVNKRGYVYVGRANAGQKVEIQIKPRAPSIRVNLRDPAFSSPDEFVTADKL